MHVILDFHPYSTRLGTYVQPSAAVWTACLPAAAVPVLFCRCWCIRVLLFGLPVGARLLTPASIPTPMLLMPVDIGTTVADSVHAAILAGWKWMQTHLTYWEHTQHLLGSAGCLRTGRVCGTASHGHAHAGPPAADVPLCMHGSRASSCCLKDLRGVPS